MKKRPKQNRPSRRRYYFLLASSTDALVVRELTEEKALMKFALKRLRMKERNQYFDEAFSALGKMYTVSQIDIML